MFKGFRVEIEEEFKKKQETDKFVFSFSDLELVEINKERRKCRIISEELSKELHKIFSQGKSGYIPPIKFIDFELLTTIYQSQSSIFPSIGDLLFNYTY